MATSGWNYFSVTRQQFYFLDHTFNRSSDVIAAITHDPRQNSVELTVMPFDNDALIDIQSPWLPIISNSSITTNSTC